ncbi:MAG: hypothetical protein GX455_10320, partial [Phycisphaerae bacterium]|nr:hypothetical protein [Phycisphaerae bacterium]
MVLADHWLDNGTRLVISEFLASNGNADFDEDGDSSDWIELFNPTNSTVHLQGWHLTNDSDNLCRWTFPDIDMIPGQYRVIYASGKNRTSTSGPLHTNFNLNVQGGYLALVQPDGKTINASLEPEYPKQYENISYGISQKIEKVTLISRGANARLLVPSALEQWSSQWYRADYDDTGWNDVQIGIGYDTQAGIPQDVINVALSKPTWQSSTGFNLGSELAVDGDLANFTHTVNTDNDATWRVNLQGSYYISKIILHNRDNCCQTRLRDITVKIRNAGDTEDVWISELLNPENVDNSPEYILIDLVQQTGSTVYGGIVQVHRTPDPDLSGTDGEGNADEPTVLSLGEVQVFASEFANEYSQIIKTDVQSRMKDKNASAFMRIPFAISGDMTYEILTLRMRYDDGFIAYLNGVMVAQRNAPSSVFWNATATQEHERDAATVYEVIDLSSSMNLLGQNNVLAIHGLNLSPEDDDFLIDVELVASTIRLQSYQYIKEPTPGADNKPGYTGVVDDTKFSHDRGFYEDPFDVRIQTPVADAAIYYTLNGTEPSPSNGTLYANPIPITRTTCLRARAYKEGWLPSNIDTQTYVFLDNVINQPANPAGFPTSWNGTAADYEMDPDVTKVQQNSMLIRESLRSLPTISIVTDPDNLFGGSYGIYANPTQDAYERADGSMAWEVPTSVEYFDPHSEREFQIDCGLRMQGGYFRSPSACRKHSFRLLFKRRYGSAKLEVPLFDYDANSATRFDTLVLRAGANDGYAWDGMGAAVQYTRDQFGRALQSATGQVAAHGLFVHLYVNGLYWGLYNLCERPDDSFSTSYFGGDKEDWDVFKHKNFELDAGTRDALNAMLALSQTAATSSSDYQRLQGRNPDGSRNPSYPHLLDVSNYIDYMLVNFWTGNWDWPWNNYWLARKRTSDSSGFKFFCWDIEDIIHSSRSPVQMDKISSPDSREVGIPHGYLRNNEEYKLEFADHIHKFMFNNGILTPAWLVERYAQMADSIQLSILAESARWGDQHYSTPLGLAEWERERDYILNIYLQQRTDIVLQQCRNAGLYPQVSAPQFRINGALQHGGNAASGASLSMTNPNTVTTESVELVSEGALVRAFVPSDNTLGTTWTTKTFTPGAGWTDGSTGTGVGYDRSTPYDALILTNLESAMYNQQSSVYCRIPFAVTNSSDIITLKLHMKYDDGFIAYLNGSEVCRSGNITNSVPPSAACGDHAAGSYVEYDISSYQTLLS